ncbi:hypothetical protein MPSEU_000927100 [Mayamaea pseudoterrestris]|nr:hypothetical protein MPSEU_000927100 [Mayamaea pseudoterrestris]
MVHLCKNCCQYVHGNSEKAPNSECINKDERCFVCLGFWQDGDENSLQQRLAHAVQEATKLYGGTRSNRFVHGSSTVNMNHLPRIVLPGDLVHRYKLAIQQKAGATKSSTPISTFADRLKKYATKQLDDCIERLSQMPLWEMEAKYPAEIINEEQGYLCVHVLLTLPTEMPRPMDLIPANPLTQQQSRRTRRQRKQLDVSQGGDPRVNHEERIERTLDTRIWSINQALATSQYASKHDDDILMSKMTGELSIDVAVWRKPFYLGAKYTKSRRDVSQTPFFVPSHDVVDGEPSKKRRLGVTSVEEQIVAVMERHVGGVSSLNEEHVPLTSGVQFGMIKFHASGREDMDVRMMLPTQVPTDKSICGRPFVCEVTDALRMPTKPDLVQIVNAINHTAINGDAASNTTIPTLNIKDPSRAYGCNPLGVDVSPDLSFVRAAAYSSLQAETEEKIKHYACYCWSEKPFTSIENLQEQLQLHTFPLQIQQKTPIRVLHRRVNMTRVRHVLSCRIERTDDHHFILHISTDAGTYVKEWCHGDLGRTAPNLSTLLGCKTDILQLDCEGIEML